MLFLVNKTLRAIASNNGIHIEKKETKIFSEPVWRLFLKNQFLVFSSVVFLLLSSAYFAYGWLMQIGVDQGYMPVQPYTIHTKYIQVPMKLIVNIVIHQQEFLSILVFHH